MNILAKVRAAAFAVWFYSVTLAFCLLGLPVRLFAPRLALLVARNWVRTVLAGMVPIIGIRLVLSGREHLPIDGPALLACQHQSEFDTLVWLTLLKLPSYVMKQELTRIPLFGPLLVPAGMIPVDRSGGAAALRKLLDDAADAARRGRQVVIFPEGTRVPPGQRVPLQPGVAAIAARLNLPVLPVATDSGLRWTRALLSRRSGPIHLMVGPPIAAGTPRKELLAAIEAFWSALTKTSTRLWITVWMLLAIRPCRGSPRPLNAFVKHAFSRAKLTVARLCRRSASGWKALIP